MTSTGTGVAPRVSVVVPVFNGERTVRQTLESVLAQSFRDFEVLVIDDGSTDGTAAIVDAIADTRVRRLHFPNRGLAASRNRGIREARGEFVAFLDADDLWQPDKLALQVAALRARPAAALVYGWSDCIDEAGGFLVQGSHIEASGPVYEKLLMGNFFDNGSTALARAAALGGPMVFDESLSAAEDWDLWLRLAHDHEVACVPAVVTLYRVHAGAMSSDLGRQERECARVLSAAVERLPPARRKSLRRASLAMLYWYLTGRALLGRSGRARGLLAARYLARYLRYVTPGRESAAYAASQFVRILIVLGLPSAWSDQAMAKLAARSAQRRTRD